CHPAGMERDRDGHAIARIAIPALRREKCDDIRRAFDAADREPGVALVIQPDSVLQHHRGTITELAAKHRMPGIYAAREFIDAGGLALYGVSYPDLYRRAATYVDRIFKGAKPADLPIEQPTRFELVLNLKTAKALGLEMPASVLARADEVIEGGEGRLKRNLPRRTFLHLAAGVAALPAVARIARAEAYPSRPVRLLVGFAPSGPND